MNFLKNFKNSLKDYDFVKNSKKFMIGSASLILVGILVLIFFGFNLGIDFTGGTVLKIKIGSTLEDAGVYNTYISQIETVLNNNNLSLSLKQQEGTGEDASIIIRFQDIDGFTESEMEDVITLVRAEIATELGILENQVQESQRIGPSATASLLLNALLAVLFATILILIYIAIRFELLSGLSAVIALAHDVLIVLSVVAIVRLQINSAFIAALITIIGYSINDTIVVFDRVRENAAKDSYKNKTNSEIVNISIKETLVRTLNTSATTLFMITMLAIISVPTIREFAIPIVIGLLSGTYSSIFIATPIWALVNDKTKPKNKNAKTLKAPKMKTEKKEIIEV
jgi:preprotein translocase subunit SecF